jgi:uncharacterized membrane protein
MNRQLLLNIAIFSFFGLFILLMAWNTVLAPSTRFPVALVLLVFITPLLLPFRGLLDGRLKSCTWISYVSLIYIVHGVLEAYANPAERYLAIAEIILSLALCFSAGFYVYRTPKN